MMRVLKPFILASSLFCVAALIGCGPVVEPSSEAQVESEGPLRYAMACTSSSQCPTNQYCCTRSDGTYSCFAFSITCPNGSACPSGRKCWQGVCIADTQDCLP